jgi:hypothetical protein
MGDVEPCIHRILMPKKGVIFCRHSRVRPEIIGERVCTSCPFINQEAVQRPAPELNPDFLTRVYNFGKAAGAHLLNNMEQATEATQAERKSICEGGCPYWSADLARCQHKQCGCTNMAKKWEWSSSVCPDGRWGSE